MEGEGYFTGLLNETHNNLGLDWDGESSPPEERQEPTPTSKGNRRSRNKNLSEKEDLLLVRAWLNTGFDPISETNQKRAAYWTRVHEAFISERDIALDRTPNSLYHRWTIIQESVNKFCGCFTAIEGRNQSGKTFENKLMDARTLYQAEDKDKKSFQFLHCWNILRLEPKWHEKMALNWQLRNLLRKNKAAGDSFLDWTGNSEDEMLNAAINENVEAPKRPIGRKKAKKQLSIDVGDACIQAFDHMWEKKKATDDEK